MMKACVLAQCLGVVVPALAQVIQWDVARVPLERAATLQQIRHRAIIEEVLDRRNDVGGYVATCRIGTPPQPISLILDTGSSDIWAPASEADACSHPDNPGPQCILGSFNSRMSTTFELRGEGTFDIEYLDGSFSQGDYFTDAFEIGNVSVPNVIMGLGRNISSQSGNTFGVAGIGYNISEAIFAKTLDMGDIYPNLPRHLKDAGLIPTVAYSLWLNDPDASTGSILFGGVDTEKYEGPLTRIQIYPEYYTNLYAFFQVALSSIDYNGETGFYSLSGDYPYPIMLDSGATVSYLPEGIAQAMWGFVGAEYSDTVEAFLVPCDRRDSDSYFTFTFGGPDGAVIRVDLAELVLPLSRYSNIRPVFEYGVNAGKDACLFGIQGFDAPPYILGDTFLRSAYVVYDIVNNQVALAKTVFNATSSNIVPFESDGAQIPFATPAPMQPIWLGDPVTKESWGGDDDDGSGAGQIADSPSPWRIVFVAVLVAVVFCTF